MAADGRLVPLAHGLTACSSASRTGVARATNPIGSGFLFGRRPP